MGMYNIINTRRRCPTCDANVEWQSKYLTYDGFVLENLLQEIRLTKHMDGEMHTYCDKCSTAIEVNIINGKESEVKKEI